MLPVRNLPVSYPTLATLVHNTGIRQITFDNIVAYRPKTQYIDAIVTKINQA